MGQKVEPKVLDAALSAVAAHHPDADVVQRGVASAYATDEGDHRTVFLDAEVRESIAPGTVYATWVVTFYREQIVDIDTFVSVACARPNARA
ncbi:MAG: hypothetical protein KF901_18945 [Myxococcales bacterium]|nr:hypothetical protein [Myxococcales bacterium]